MAQPVLDEQSPLDDYLRESELDLMPGTLPEYCISSESSNDVAPWVPSSVLSFCHSLESLLCPPANQPTGRQFAERFKYIIISSSLLSAFLSPSSLSPPSSRLAETPSSGSDVNHVPITASALLLFLVAPISLASGYWIITIASVLLANFYFYAAPPTDGEKPLQARSTLESLHSLVEADVAWESAIGEAMALLRRDEEASSSIQWQTPLRVSLQSSLQAVTVHVDRVRHLFSPLTSPNELAQMSEMYAPPSPTVSHQSLASPDKLRTSTTPNKRTTWSGPSSKQLARRSTDIYGLFARPGSPIPPVPRLPQHPSSPSEGSENSFGALDLDIYKNRTTPQRHSLATPRSAGSLRPSPTAVSRFTAMQSMRNPLSMSSMDAALQAALDSKRFACAHLLALRFDEEEDDLYWEDVRAVMSLLSTSLEDETARLSQAMDEWHHARQRDARPSATSTPSPSSEPEAEPNPPRMPRRTHRQLTSFAPSSSQMAKATTHMDSIASALDRAFGQLETCVSSLRQHDTSESSETNELEQSTQAAMSAYESLRRELGLALRECERARSPILSVLNNSSADASSDEEVPLNGGPLDGTPVSRAQVGDDDFPDSPTRAGASSPPPAYVSRGPSQIVDDATAHLLAGATAGELPPFGADRVFEADSESANAANNNTTTSSSNTTSYAKERSTLSRAERIALAQAKRRSMRASQAQTPVYGGTDIVAELKEVISRVNERKQRMAAVAASLPARRASMALDNVDFLESRVTDAPDGAVLVSTASTVSP